jgi:hypothetical protein
MNNSAGGTIKTPFGINYNALLGTVNNGSNPVALCMLDDTVIFDGIFAQDVDGNTAYDLDTSNLYQEDAGEYVADDAKFHAYLIRSSSKNSKGRNEILGIVFFQQRLQYNETEEYSSFQKYAGSYLTGKEVKNTIDSYVGSKKALVVCNLAMQTDDGTNELKQSDSCVKLTGLSSSNDFFLGINYNTKLTSYSSYDDTYPRLFSSGQDLFYFDGFVDSGNRNVDFSDLSNEKSVAYIDDNALYHSYLIVGTGSVGEEIAGLVFVQEKWVSDADTSTNDTTTSSATIVTQSYILNTNSCIFHYPDCSSVSRMSEKNKEIFYGSRDDAVAQGYTPCSICKP